MVDPVVVATKRGVVSESSTSPSAVLLALLRGNDVTELSPAIDDSSLLHMPGRSGLAGSYQGGEAIAGLMRPMRDASNRTLRFDPADVLLADDRLIIICGRSSGTRGTHHLDTRFAHVALLERGRIRAMWFAHDNQDQVDGFWS